MLGDEQQDRKNVLPLLYDKAPRLTFYNCSGMEGVRSQERNRKKLPKIPKSTIRDDW